MSLRIAIFVIAYDAVNTLASTIDRIPPEVMDKVEEIFVIDDCSNDNTYYAALGYKESRKLEKLQVFRNPVNLRYGGNQKRGYQYAIERGFDVVVMLHADGQYAPEVLPRLLEPLERGEADMVFGSRMAEGGDPLKGGMPLYKFFGNKILTWLENHIIGMHLSEFHSGYRLYSTHALRRVPFMLNSDEWHFDTEILIQFKEAGLRIAERPIPTYYGDEICHVNGIAYAFNCIKSALGYRFHKNNWIHLPHFDVTSDRPRFEPDPHSHYAELLELVEAEKPARVLQVGTGNGFLTARLQAMGCTVVGIEREPELAEAAAAYCERMIVGDVEALDLAGLGTFEMVVVADQLAYWRTPQAVLARLVERLALGGHLVATVPNVAMWLWRWRLLTGRFEGMTLGRPAETPLRFFTRASAEQLVRKAGLRLAGARPVALPLPALSPSFGPGRGLSLLQSLNHWLTHLRPTLLAYQFVLLAQKPTKPAVVPALSGPLGVPTLEKRIAPSVPVPPSLGE